MGLVWDPQNSSISFSNPTQGAVFGAISNFFVCVMYQFGVDFAFRFDPNPRRGVGGSPATRESWEIGIVQNVVYEKIDFEYSDGTAFTNVFTSAALDSVAQIHQPFYHDPVRMPACQLAPNLPCSRYIPVMVPVVDLWYTSQGYGDLLDPWHPSGVAITNSPQSVNMVDEPTFGGRLRLSNGAIVTKAEHILGFQIWLIAKRQSQVHMLANVAPFSMVFWLSTQPTPNLLTIGTPAHSFGFYGSQGIVRTVIHSSGVPANIRIQSGAGGRSPVLGGQTANDRGRRWLRSNGLLP